MKKSAAVGALSVSASTPHAADGEPPAAPVVAVPAMILVAALLWASALEAMCFEEAGRLYNISPLLLRSIAQVESQFNPRAIKHNRNGTYDYGIMQINSSWAPKLGRQLWQSLGDPCTNVKVGAWILAQSISLHGYCWDAVGFYNARDPVKRRQYIRKINSALGRQGDL